MLGKGKPGEIRRRMHGTEKRVVSNLAAKPNNSDPYLSLLQEKEHTCTKMGGANYEDDMRRGLGTPTYTFHLSSFGAFIK
jgi:hypothetical protein